jgi:predicted DNA-binding transcriptional regulator AlpA
VSDSANPSDSTAPLEPRHKVRLTMREGASRAGCSPRHLYTLAYSGEIPTYMAAGHRWVDQADIDAYMARCKAAGPQFGRATGKRRPGRPKRKPVETASASAEEADRRRRPKTKAGA